MVKLKALHDTLEAAEAMSKAKFDQTWREYELGAPPNSANALFEKLGALVAVSKAPRGRVCQLPTLNTAEALLEASHAHNFAVHEALARLVGCGDDNKGNGESAGAEVTYHDGGHRYGACARAPHSFQPPLNTGLTTRHTGPVKALKRLQAKAQEYGGDVTRIVDTCRSSALGREIIV